MEVSPVTVALIGANLLASGWALFGDRGFLDQFVFHVDSLKRRGEHFRIFTSSFLHANLAHLAFNMLALLSFGPAVEEILGRTGFLVVYFGAILVSGIISFAMNRHNPTYSSLGASDAVSGIVFAFIVFYPLDKIYLLGIPFGIPAILFGVLFLVVSSALMRAENRIIAHEGHLGGALAGIVLTLLLEPSAFQNFFATFAA